MKLIFLIPAILLVSLHTSASNVFVAPNGSSKGDGTITKPYDLNTVLRGASKVRAGDTVYLRGGNYLMPVPSNGFKVTLSGAPDKSITFRSYTDEWAIIDGNLTGRSGCYNVTMFAVSGSYLTFRDFEITNTQTDNRVISVKGSNPCGRRGSALDDRGSFNKFINLVIHDTGQGITAWSNGQGGEYYGNIVYLNGWDAPDRPHGHNLYAQNTNRSKLLKHNVLLDPFGHIWQLYGSSAANVVNMTLDGNVFVNGSTTSGAGIMDNFVYKNNKHFYSRPTFGREPKANYKNAYITNNYFADGVTAADWTNFVFTGNTVFDNNPKGTLVSFITAKNPATFARLDNNNYFRCFLTYPYWNFFASAVGGRYAYDKVSGTQVKAYNYTGKSWKNDLGFDANSTFTDNPPGTNVVFVEPNLYQNGRGMVVIYNWELRNTVAVDLSSILQTNDSFRIRNVQDYNADIIYGKYTGASVSVEMKNRTQAVPVGYNRSKFYHNPLGENTFPKFGVFIVERTSKKNAG